MAQDAQPHCDCRQPGVLGGDCDGSCQCPPPTCTCVECVDAADGDIPEGIRRDKNNRAPFMADTYAIVTVRASEPLPSPAKQEQETFPWQKTT